MVPILVGQATGFANLATPIARTHVLVQLPNLLAGLVS